MQLSQILRIITLLLNNSNPERYLDGRGPKVIINKPQKPFRQKLENRKGENNEKTI